MLWCWQNHYNIWLHEHFDDTSLKNNHNHPCDFWVEHNQMMVTNNYHYFLSVQSSAYWMYYYLPDEGKILILSYYYLECLRLDLRLQSFSYLIYWIWNLNISKIKMAYQHKTKNKENILENIFSNLSWYLNYWHWSYSLALYNLVYYWSVLVAVARIV